MTTVKQLRALTGAGPLDCKNALTASNGDLEQAAAYLRDKGLAKAASKAGRATTVGLVVIRQEPNAACVLELNCETDFVANTNEFKSLAHGLAAQVVSDPSLNTVDALYQANADAIQQMIGRMGENITIGRLARFDGSGLIESYIHSGELDGVHGPLEGRIGVLVQLSTRDSVDPNALRTLAHDLALHIASARPLDLAELMNQPFIKDDRISIADLIGASVGIERFACFEIGA